MYSPQTVAKRLSLLAKTPVDCIVLDAMMPGMSGFEVPRQIRGAADTPVLFLSTRQADDRQDPGPGPGADDFIVKSATPGQNVARVKAVLRRTSLSSGARPASDVRAFGGPVIDFTAREVRVNGTPVALTPREFELLELLTAHSRCAFSTDDLFERLWGIYGDRHTVRVNVARLREKIEEDVANPRLLVTVRGVGYRSAAPARCAGRVSQTLQGFDSAHGIRRSHVVVASDREPAGQRRSLHAGGRRNPASLWQKNGQSVFSIADSGPGIPAGDLPHIFSPLYRGESSRDRRTGGSGLGLAIVRRLLRAHGGDLRGTNGWDGGAVFTGVLPLEEHAA